jgi:hypothetical protein
VEEELGVVTEMGVVAVVVVVVVAKYMAIPLLLRAVRLIKWLSGVVVDPHQRVADPAVQEVLLLLRDFQYLEVKEGDKGVLDLVVRVDLLVAPQDNQVLEVLPVVAGVLVGLAF